MTARELEEFKELIKAMVIIALSNSDAEYCRNVAMKALKWHTAKPSGETE